MRKTKIVFGIQLVNTICLNQNNVKKEKEKELVLWIFIIFLESCFSCLRSGF